jgi:AcrR family transcriptional regulator
MAAIGYHFVSREVLLNATLIEAIDEWGTRMGRALGSFGDSKSSPADRYEAMWAAIIKSFQDDRTLWLATLEALSGPNTPTNCAATSPAARPRGAVDWPPCC